jgi:putative transposase
MANRAIIYRLYPNEKQKVQFQKTFGCVRFVYNQMLTVQEERYKNNESHLSKFEMNYYCNNVLKIEHVWLKEVDKFALTNAIYHLEDGYQRMFKHLGKHPKYKNKHTAKRSYTTNFTNNNISIGDNYVKLPKVGKVKAKISLDVSLLKIKSATITQNRDDSYQVSILVEYDEVPITVGVATEDNTIGLDYKSDGLYVDSNGDIADMPHYYRKSAHQLAKRQRKLKNKVVGSNNYYKQQKKVAKIHRHIANQRKDYLHQKSTEIVNQYDFVCVEDLNMKAMSNKGFSNGKATMDNGYGMFLVFLDYKLQERGGKLVKVDKYYPSSQLCSCCGFQNAELKNLFIREWICPNCGTYHDRDRNAALNIKTEGLRLLGAS